MRKAVVVLALGLMAVGLLLTAFGTREMTTIANQSCAPSASVCEITGLYFGHPNEASFGFYLPTTSHANFTLNYFGGFLAILGAVGFAFTYPLKRSDALRSCSMPSRS